MQRLLPIHLNICVHVFTLDKPLVQFTLPRQFLLLFVLITDPWTVTLVVELE